MAQVSDVVCPTCKAIAAMRISRTGFLQQNVLWHFGVYPWKCGACGSTFLSRKRKSKADSNRQEADTVEQRRRA
jgi:ssDNA-binding Zn-finger/Zn-ribbon topoisomerase 1